MNFTYKLSKRLAIIKSVLVLSLGVSVFACQTDNNTGSSVPHITQLVMVPESVSVDASQTYQLKVYGRTAAATASAPTCMPLPGARAIRGRYRLRSRWYRASPKVL